MNRTSNLVIALCFLLVLALPAIAVPPRSSSATDDGELSKSLARPTNQFGGEEWLTQRSPRQQRDQFGGDDWGVRSGAYPTTDTFGGEEWVKLTTPSTKNQVKGNPTGNLVSLFGTSAYGNTRRRGTNRNDVTRSSRSTGKRGLFGSLVNRAY